MRFKIFTIILSVFLLSSVGILSFSVTHAQESDGEYDAGPMIYKFHLQWKNGQLTPIVKDFLPYDFVADEFADRAGLYYGRVFSVQNQQLGEFHYDLTEGSNDVFAPYFPDAKTVAFYRSNIDKDPLLALSVSKTALCNDDKVCQQEAGETANNCPKDCATGTATNANTPPPANNNEAVNPTVQKYYNFLIVFFIILAIAIVVVFAIILIRRNRNNNE